MLWIVIVYVRVVWCVCVCVCVAGCGRRFLSPSSGAEEEKAAGEDWWHLQRSAEGAGPKVTTSSAVSQAAPRPENTDSIIYNLLLSQNAAECFSPWPWPWSSGVVWRGGNPHLLASVSQFRLKRKEAISSFRFSLKPSSSAGGGVNKQPLTPNCKLETATIPLSLL